MTVEGEPMKTHLLIIAIVEVYFVMLSMAMLVSVISLGRSLCRRHQCREASSSCDFATARLCALRRDRNGDCDRIRSDPTWRTDLGNGTWFNCVQIGGGNYTVSAVDPITGDITQNTNHPVVLTSTGAANAASYILQVQLQINPGDLSCVEVSSCIGSDTNLASCILTSNQTITSDNNLNLDPHSTLNGNVEAAENISDKGTINGNQTIIASEMRIVPIRCMFSIIIKPTAR